MDSFPKSQIIEFNRTDVTSIEQALVTYQTKLAARQAFKNSQFDIVDKLPYFNLNQSVNYIKLKLCRAYLLLLLLMQKGCFSQCEN